MLKRHDFMRRSVGWRWVGRKPWRIRKVDRKEGNNITLAGSRRQKKRKHLRRDVQSTPRPAILAGPNSERKRKKKPFVNQKGPQKKDRGLSDAHAPALLTEKSAKQLATASSNARAEGPTVGKLLDRRERVERARERLRKVPGEPERVLRRVPLVHGFRQRTRDA